MIKVELRIAGIPGKYLPSPRGEGRYPATASSLTICDLRFSALPIER